MKRAPIRRPQLDACRRFCARFAGAPKFLRAFLAPWGLPPPRVCGAEFADRGHMRNPPRTRRLPIVFRSLDLEEKTKPVPCVVCPVRADIMTVGNCGRCRDFRRIEFSDDAQPLLRCATQLRIAGTSSQPPRVQDVVRVPVFCAAADTTLASVLPYLILGTAQDAIPTLDSEARPMGFVTISELRILVAAGIPLDTALVDVMSQRMTCVLPETALADAERRVARENSQRLMAVNPDGTFLGCVPLSAASSSGPAAHGCA